MSDSTCSICLCAFNKPKGLPCFHTFCQECLQLYISNIIMNKGGESFPCPMCRTETRPQDPEKPVKEWAASFPNNIYVQNEDESKGKYCLPVPNSDIKAPIDTASKNHVPKATPGTGGIPQPSSCTDMKAASKNSIPTATPASGAIPQSLSFITDVSLGQYRFYGANDMVMLPDQCFLISLAYNKTLFKFSSTGEYVTEHKYSDSEPFGLCLLQYNCVAVSQPRTKKVSILDCTDLSENCCFSFEKSYKGLASDDGEKLFCIYRDVNVCVDIISKNNPQSTYQIIHFVKLPSSIYTCHEYRLRVVPSSGNVVIINWTNSLNVVCFDQSGEEVFKYEGDSDHLLSSISDVAVSKDFILVADKSANKIHRIQHDGSFVDVPLTADDDISKPAKIYVNSEGSLAILWKIPEQPQIKIFCI